jgi:pimeloyl-ACP methyl ester carboxylesterase
MRGRLARGRALLWVALALAVLAAGFAAAYGPSLVRSTVLLAASVDLYDAESLKGALSYEVRVTPESLALQGRSLRAIRYAPVGRSGRAEIALLVHGAHPRGIEEPRFVRFARALASVGIEVHTPELPDLLSFQLSSRVADDIGTCAAGLAKASGQRVGSFGISFGGGLLLLAAGREPGASALDYVVALGAYSDLRRLARHYAGEPIAAPDGRARADQLDPYGSRILATAFAEDVFPPAEAVAARNVLRLHLAEQYREAARLRAQLSPAAQASLRELLGSPSPATRAGLLAAVRRHDAELLQASPAGQLARLRVPVFLVHGREDPIIPSVESEWLARQVPSAALRRVLITSALRHAESLGAPEFAETARLIAFMAAVLRESR